MSMKEAWYWTEALMQAYIDVYPDPATCTFISDWREDVCLWIGEKKAARYAAAQVRASLR